MKLGALYRSIPSSASIVIVHRAVLDRYTEEFIRYAKLRGSVVVYDTDDLLFTNSVAGYLHSGGKKQHASDINSYRKAIENCDAVLVSTEFLKQKVSLFHKDVKLVKNALSSDYLKVASRVVRHEKKNAVKPVTIAYLSGSDSHDRDFQLVEDTLLRILSNYENSKLLLVGRLNFSDKFSNFSDRFEYREFVPYKFFPKLFIDIDINLVPLEVDQEFCQAKSELKYIEAGACGVPSVASPTKTYMSVIEPNVNGLLAEDHAWYEAIEKLLIDHEFRNRLGENAREHVLCEYGPKKSEVKSG